MRTVGLLRVPPAPRVGPLVQSAGAGARQALDGRTGPAAGALSARLVPQEQAVGWPQGSSPPFWGWRPAVRHWQVQSHYPGSQMASSDRPQETQSRHLSSGLSPPGARPLQFREGPGSGAGQQLLPSLAGVDSPGPACPSLVTPGLLSEHAAPSSWRGLGRRESGISQPGRPPRDFPLGAAV